ncbi:MAG: pyridoxal kinase [Pseudomonadota bacterium]
MTICLSIQSHVVAGYVGQNAANAVLTAAGVELWSLPTVHFSAHAATKGVTGRRATGPELSNLGLGLSQAGDLARVDAILTGYLGSEDAGEAAAAIVAHCPADSPYLCDPVLGDDGRLYVPPGLISTYRERLIPRATIATPNVHELGWLTDLPVRTLPQIVAAARALGPKIVHVTSVNHEGQVGILTQTAERRTLALGAPADVKLHGAGDAVAAMLMASHLEHRPPAQSAARAVAAVAALATAAASAGRNTLPLTAEQALWQDPCHDAHPYQEV